MSSPEMGVSATDGADGRLDRTRTTVFPDRTPLIICITEVRSHSRIGLVEMVTDTEPGQRWSDDMAASQKARFAGPGRCTTNSIAVPSERSRMYTSEGGPLIRNVLKRVEADGTSAKPWADNNSEYLGPASPGFDFASSGLGITSHLQQNKHPGQVVMNGALG
ncbi:hypothetical protein CPLU01_14885 [Colletotrichum plurivorum]|uniref:Uncharacterized protein n=1 Tax=Colletotrichum plurivorum TaxID=2175906 RepID=A0A8H6JG44_9PEZI|nr:hypothetical protein CPLU01_14885 [Colletotrichum plurivorum]